MGHYGNRNHQELTVTFGKASHGAASCLQNKIIPIVTIHKNPRKLRGFLCLNSLSEEISDTQKIRTNGNLAIFVKGVPKCKVAVILSKET